MMENYSSGGDTAIVFKIFKTLTLIQCAQRETDMEKRAINTYDFTKIKELVLNLYCHKK